MTDKELILHKGDRFASEGGGRFAKDVVRVGKWVHPATGREVVFTPERIRNLVKNTTDYLARGNKIPFPDGHTTDTSKNLGFWPGPFIEYKGALVGVVEPKDELALKKIQDGTLDAVSVCVDFDVMDPSGKKYDEVITHVCATNYPVITKQKEFIKLSRESGSGLYLPEELSALAREGEEKPSLEALSALDQLTEAVKLAQHDPFEDCVLSMKTKGMDKEAAVAACEIRFKGGKKESMSREHRVVAALVELSLHEGGTPM